MRGNVDGSDGRPGKRDGHDWYSRKRVRVHYRQHGGEGCLVGSRRAPPGPVHAVGRPGHRRGRRDDEYHLGRDQERTGRNSLAVWECDGPVRHRGTQLPDCVCQGARVSFCHVRAQQRRRIPAR